MGADGFTASVLLMIPPPGLDAAPALLPAPPAAAGAAAGFVEAVAAADPAAGGAAAADFGAAAVAGVVPLGMRAVFCAEVKTTAFTMASTASSCTSLAMSRLIRS